MRFKYPLKKLSVLNIGLISVCSLFVFAFVIVLLGVDAISDAIQGAILTMIILMLTGFANILWLYLFMKSFSGQIFNYKKVYYAISYSFSILVFITVQVSYNRICNHPTTLLELFNLIGVCLFVNTLIIIIHNYVALQDAKVKADMENSQLKAANAEAANQLLRQQIHPHFFFNALNILKSLYKIDQVAAEEYLVCLSDFLRLSVSSNNIKIIPLKDELKLCEDYLGMQKIRFGDALVCSISIDDEILNNRFVPSFSIQPLLENAIKHNELTNASPLRIIIQQEGDRIVVSNNIKPKQTTEASSGIGLANLAERYRILSNDELLIENKENTFSVSIRVLKQEAIANKS